MSNNILIFVNETLLLYNFVFLAIIFAQIKIKDNLISLTILCIFSGLLKLFFHLYIDTTLAKVLVPLYVHLPIFLVIFIYYKKSFKITIIAMLCAFTLCAPREQLGMFASYILDNNIRGGILTKILVTIPLFYLYITKGIVYVNKIIKSKNKMAIYFVIALQACYYFLACIFNIFSGYLYSNNLILAIIIAINIVYIFFSLIYFNVISENERVNTLSRIHEIELQSAKDQIKQLRDNEKLTAIYRHDLIHHMNFLSNCINNNNSPKALDYIHEVVGAIENIKVVRYLNDEDINLLLTYYVKKAKDENIAIEIETASIDLEKYNTTDLCRLLSNALTNAINACNKMNKSNAFIKLRVFQSNFNIGLEILNSYSIPPIFSKNIPISNEVNHGYGVASIIDVVNKYDGSYYFSAIDGVFTLRVII